MANIICHYNGRYNIYGTLSESFMLNNSVNVEELKIDIFNNDGKKALDELPERLSRAKLNGASTYCDAGLEELLICNRAGEDEENLSLDECIKRFLT